VRRGEKFTQRRRLRIAALLFAIPFLAAAPLPTAWNHWRYSRAIELSAVASPQLASVTIGPDVFQHAQLWLGDVRVMDDRSAETPYVLFLRAGEKRTDPRPTILHERSFAPGRYTQVVIEIAERGAFHNAIEVETSESDFIEWVSVDASDDGQVWRIVQQRAPIFRFRKDGRQGTQVVHYSENNARFLRLRILDGDKQFPLNGANVLYQTQDAPERVEVDTAIAPAAQAIQEKTVWIADLGGAEQPVSDVNFDVAAPGEFIRSVEVQASSDNKVWRPLARGEIYRYRQGDFLAEQLSVSVPFGGAEMRYWRVEIVNHNDSPLAGVTPHLYSIPRHIVFEQQPDRTYRLLYGQSRAKTPEYDLSRRLNEKQMEAAVAGRLGSEELNTDWSDPRPWTEKYDVVLWLALGLAVILLGYSAVRSLRRSTHLPAD
jgi:hypothetical protein